MVRADGSVGLAIRLNPVGPPSVFRTMPGLQTLPRTDEPAATPQVRRRPVAATVCTLLAGLIVFLALVLPREVGQLTPLAFLRIPVEGLLMGAVVLVLRGRARRV